MAKSEKEPQIDMREKVLKGKKQLASFHRHIAAEEEWDKLWTEKLRKAKKERDIALQELRESLPEIEHETLFRAGDYQFPAFPAKEEPQEATTKRYNIKIGKARPRDSSERSEER